MNNKFQTKEKIKKYTPIPYYLRLPDGERISFSNPGVGFDDDSFVSLQKVTKYMEESLLNEIVYTLYHLFINNKELESIQFNSSYIQNSRLHSYLNQDLSILVETGNGNPGFFKSMMNIGDKKSGRISINKSFADNIDKYANEINASGVSLKLIKQTINSLFDLMRKAYDRNTELPFKLTQSGYVVNRNDIDEVYYGMKVDQVKDLQLYMSMDKILIPWQLNSILQYYGNRETGEPAFKYESFGPLSGHVNSYAREYGSSPWDSLKNGIWNENSSHPLNFGHRSYSPSVDLINSLFEVIEAHEKANALISIEKAIDENPNANRIIYLERKGYLLDDRYPVSHNVLNSGYIHEAAARMPENPNIINTEMDREWLELRESYHLTRGAELNFAISI